jgi:hypothetical protein
MKKKWPKHSIVIDVVKRNAMHRFLKKAYPNRAKDGRVGLLVCIAWDAGYEAGRRRAQRR